MLASFLMLVRFKFWRVGYYAEGLIEHDNLDDAAERLWREHPSTFRWVQLEKQGQSNRLTVEEWKDEKLSSSTGTKAKT